MLRIKHSEQIRAARVDPTRITSIGIAELKISAHSAHEAYQFLKKLFVFVISVHLHSG